MAQALKESHPAGKGKLSNAHAADRFQEFKDHEFIPSVAHLNLLPGKWFIWLLKVAVRDGACDRLTLGIEGSAFCRVINQGKIPRYHLPLFQRSQSDQRFPPRPRDSLYLSRLQSLLKNKISTTAPIIIFVS